MSAAHNQSSLVSSATILARSNRISKSMSRATLSAVMACLVGSSAIVCAQPKKQSAVGSRQSAANNKQLAANRQPPLDNRRAAPIPPPTREQMPPQPPRVTFRNGLLSIHADNSTMADVMSAIRRATGASLDLPASAAGERVVSDLGPAAPNDVLVKLLDGSRFDYVILQSPQNPSLVQFILFHEKGASTLAASNAGGSPQPIFNQPQPEPPAEIPEDQTEPPAQEIPDQAVPAQDQQQQPAAEGQQQPKTPEQLLEELKQMQRQQQQQQPQQPPGQVPPQPEQPQQEQPQTQQPDNPQAPQMMDTPIPQ